MTGKKQVEEKTPPISIWNLLRKYVLGRKLIALVICISLTSIITFIRPLVIKEITDEGMLKANMKMILVFAILLLLASILEETANIVQSKQFAEIHNSMMLSLYQSAFDKILCLKKNYFTDHNSTEIINRISMDIYSVSMVADQSIHFVISYILCVIGGILGLFFLNWKMAIVVIAVIPFKTLIAVKMSNLNEKITSKKISLMQEFSSWFGDVISGIKEIKLWNLQNQKQISLLEQQDKILQTSKKSTLYNSYNRAFSNLLNNLVQCSLYIYGGFLFIQGELTLGGVTAFIAYSNQVLSPITALMSVRYMFSSIRPSMKRLNDFFLLEEGKIQPCITKQRYESERVSSLEIHNLVFSYSKDELLTGVDFTVNAGQKVAIIGANGSGKSTLVDLLLRFEKPSSGEILVNGNNAFAYPDAQYWDMFAVVEQEPYFFKDSVRNNVDPKSQYSDEHILRIFAQCGIMEFFQERFQSDLNHIVLYNAGDLSGGERKRLAIARAILKDAPILIMDEAAADYDFEAEAKLSSMIASQFADKIVIYITHNYSYLDIFDKVYQLADGKLKQLNRWEVLNLKNKSM